MTKKIMPLLVAALLALCAAPVYAEGIVIGDTDTYTEEYTEPAPPPVETLTADEVAAMISDAIPDPTPAPEPTDYPGITQEQLVAALENALSNGVKVQLTDEQFEALTATPETAQVSPFVWDKPLDEYTPQEAYSLLILAVVLTAGMLNLFSIWR